MLLCVLASAAQAHTVFVAGNGVDSGTCGAKASPCHTITRGITNAGVGDRVIVGPGRYQGESGAPGCSCFVALDKSVVVLSSAGAASTVIDARSFLVIRNVLITADGAELGRPGKGFTVTNPDAASGIGIDIESDHVKVRGNQVVADRNIAPGDGILADSGNPGPILIEGNQVMLWAKGIVAVGPARKVSHNQVSLSSFTGMVVEGTSKATSNIVTDNFEGVFLLDSSTFVGNAVYGSLTAGIQVGMGYKGTIASNDIVDNSATDNCGLENDENVGLVATNNYWGAATGPGANPADDVCHPVGGSTTTTPFATTPFTVTATIKP